MDVLVVGIAASLSAVALGCAVVSLAVHWVRRKEPPDVTELRALVHELRTEHLDLFDKVEHWVKRDRVRRLREAKEQSEITDSATRSDADRAAYKKMLRQRVRAVGGMDVKA